MLSLLTTDELIKKKNSKQENKPPLIHATLAQSAHRQELQLVLRAKIYRKLYTFQLTLQRDKEIAYAVVCAHYCSLN